MEAIDMFDFEKLSLEDRVRYFISQRRETEYWDFKQKWSGKDKLLQLEFDKHADKLSSEEMTEEEKSKLKKKIESTAKQAANEEFHDLIKDIVCFTNTCHDSNCYLVFGVTDDYQIVGIDDANRLEQSRIEDTFSSMVFANSIRPEIDVESVILEGKELQVLTIHNENQTPIYLEKQFGAMRPGCIYSRHGDKNTPNNGNSTPGEIEKLWKKRFKLLKTSLDFVFENLNNRDEWVEVEGNFYNAYQPAYNIRIVDNEESRGPEFYHFAMINPHYSYDDLSINYNETVLASFLLTWLDSGRLRIPVPEMGFVKEIYPDPVQSVYRYYLEDSNRFKLFKFLYDPTDYEQRYSFDSLAEVFLFYRSDNERRSFEHWINGLSSEIKKSVDSNKEHCFVNSNNPLEVETDVHKLALGKTLNQYLNDFRDQENYLELVEQAINL